MRLYVILVPAMVLVVKNLPAEIGDAGSVPGQEDPLEEGMAAHSSIRAWRIPWTGAWEVAFHGAAREAGGQLLYCILVL